MHDFTKGDRVKWNDPRIEDYDYENVNWAKSRVFTVELIDGDRIEISDSNGYKHIALAGELEKLQ